MACFCYDFHEVVVGELRLKELLIMSEVLRPIHIWVPGIREGTGGIQAFCRTLVLAVRESFPDRVLRVLVKNDDPLPEDELRGLGIAFTSVAGFPLALQTAMMASSGVALGLMERPIFVVAAHLHFMPALMALRMVTGIPYCGFLYGIEAWNVASWHRKVAMRAANRLISISGFTRDRVIQDNGVRRELVEIVPCTFDVSRFSVGPKPPELLERYGLRAEQPVLLTVSRLALSERYKGHRQVLIALREVVKSRPDLRYIIAGVGDDLPRLEEAVRAMGLAEYVIFAGHVPGDELPALYRLCDLFLMPSTKEGFGIVFLEAMASGKPVIAGNMDGSVDALDQGRLGALVDPNDPQVIAATVESILDRKFPLPLMFEPLALRDAVAEQFGYPRVRGLLADALRPLLGNGTSRYEQPPLKSEAVTVTSSGVVWGAGNAPRIVILTQLTSPYQVEFFNAVAAVGRCNLDVIYLTSRDGDRQWEVPRIAHSHLILNENSELSMSALTTLCTAELVVFNYYTDRFAFWAIRARAATGKPWVFWGERPGFMHLGVTGRLARRFLLAALHGDVEVPIWGVGRFGLEGYEREFRKSRPYVNLPYFSDLERFSRVKPTRLTGVFTFFYSGRLLHRKGGDLLARAFVEVAREFPQARLLIVGAGPLEAAMRRVLAPCAELVEWGNFKGWDALPASYAKADVFCFPSRYDGWGLALVEALAAGLPVIGTVETGAALEFVRPGVNGWMLPVDDVEALTKAMREAIMMPPEALGRMREAARAAVAEHSLMHGAQRFMAAAGAALGRVLLVGWVDPFLLTEICVA